MKQDLVTNFPMTDRVRAALAVSLRGCEELIPEAEWVKKLARSEATGVPLRIKLGLDPTAPRHSHRPHRGAEQNAPATGPRSHGDLPHR